jgi:hypothetical protein
MGAEFYIAFVWRLEAGIVQAFKGWCVIKKVFRHRKGGLAELHRRGDCPDSVL